MFLDLTSKYEFLYGENVLLDAASLQIQGTYIYKRFDRRLLTTCVLTFKISNPNYRLPRLC